MNDSTDWLNNNSGGSGSPSPYFGKIGDKVVGRITQLPKIVETQYGDRMVVELEALDGCTANKGKNGADGPIAAGEEITLWIKKGAMAGAVRDAVEDVEASGLGVDGILAVQFSGEKDTGKPQPVKLYTAQYKVPTPTVAVGESLI